MERDATVIEQAAALLGELAGRDVSALSDEVLVGEHAEMARLGRLRDAAQARYDAEIARRSAPAVPGGGLARAAGFGNAGRMISQVTGGSLAGARRSMEAGEALAPAVPPAAPTGAGRVGRGHPDQSADASPPSAPGSPASPAAPKYPAVAAASIAGDLSVEAAGLITSGLNTVAERVESAQVQEMERQLVAKASRLSAHEVRRMVARAVARVDRQGHEERERQHYADRHLMWKEDHTGMVTFTGRLDAVTAAPIRNTIEQVVTAQFRARRDQDPQDPDQRTVGQMRADALAEICRHALGCDQTDRSGIRTTLVVRMSLKDLNAGSGLGSIDGTDQPVSLSQLRRLAGDAGIVPEVLGGDSEVLDLGRTVRLFTRAQRIALVERDGGCAKCHAPPEHCEAHHIIWWDNGGPTDLDNGVMLCTRCHHDIHRDGWEIMVRANRVEFTPPPRFIPPSGFTAEDVSGGWDPDRAPPGLDPGARAQVGGREALDIGDVGPPRDRDGVPYPGDEFFAGNEAMVRKWMAADAERMSAAAVS